MIESDPRNQQSWNLQAGLLVLATGAALLQAARDEIRRYSESSSGWILMASCNNASE